MEPKNFMEYLLIFIVIIMAIYLIFTTSLVIFMVGISNLPSYFLSSYFSITLITAFTCSILFGAFLASLYQAKSVTIRFENRNKFVQLLKEKLSEIGFMIDVESKNMIIFKPQRSKAGLFAGPLYIKIKESKVRIEGNSYHVNRLLKMINVKS